MAGKRQHYLPKLLQRGFLDRGVTEAEVTWLHRAKGRPRRVSIRDVGVEEYFYSRPSADGSLTLDDFITNLEGDLAADINFMRSLRVGQEVQSSLAASVVTHLVIRTAHIRLLLEQLLQTFVDEATRQFAEPIHVRSLLGLNSISPSSLLIDAINELIESDAAKRSDIPKDFARRLMVFMMRELGDQLVAANSRQLQPHFEQLVAEMPTRIRDAHNAALARTPKQHAWEALLAHYSWYVDEGSDLILPDCVALAVESDRRVVPFLFAEQANTLTVILPLAADRLLVGRRSDSLGLDLSVFNEEAAACCDSFFIRATMTERSDLVDRIGTQSAQSIGQLVQKSFRDFAKSSTEEQRVETAPASASVAMSTREFSFQLRCADFGDQETASAIGQAIAEVIQELGRKLPLHDLDGITLAADYPAALRGLDRGSETLLPLETRSREYGRGVAKPVEIIRDGRRKTHIVMDASVAMGLLASDKKERRDSFSIVAKMLASVAFQSLYVHVTADERSPSEISRAFHGAAANALEIYFTTRESAIFSPSLGEWQAQLVIEALSHAKTAVTEARLTYRKDGDLGQLLDVASTKVCDILKFAACWLGHRDGLHGEGFPGDNLPALLVADGLGAWLELWGRDLQTLYEIPPGSFGARHAFMLDQHVERLLWMFQICPWLQADGSMYVSVPFGRDLELLRDREAANREQ